MKILNLNDFINESFRRWGIFNRPQKNQVFDSDFLGKYDFNVTIIPSIRELIDAFSDYVVHEGKCWSAVEMVLPESFDELMKKCNMSFDVDIDISAIIPVDDYSDDTVDTYINNWNSLDEDTKKNILELFSTYTEFYDPYHPM